MAIIATGNKGRVNGSDVNVRTDAGTGYSRVYYAQTGDIVTVQDGKYGTDGLWWLKITNETRNTSSVGWIRNDFVDPYSGGTGTWVTRWTNTPDETVNIRSGPGTSYSINTTYTHGTKVEVNTPNDTWSQVRLYGSTSVAGYVMTSFLVQSDPGGGTGTWVTRWTNTPDETVNIRSGPGTSYPINTTYSHGTKVEVNAPNSTWSQVRLYGSTSVAGYVMTSYLVQSDPGGGSSGGSLRAGNYIKVNATTVNVRDTDSTEGNLLGVLFKDTLQYCEEVTSSTWVKVRWGGRSKTYGYIMSQYLVDGGVAPTSKYQRAIAIAKSMANEKYPYPNPSEERIGNLDLTSEDWCVQYLSWLMKAAGCSSYPDFSTQATVSLAASFFGTGFGTRASGKTPSIGDWVMYSGSAGTWAHVGMVVAINGTSITTVEGNLSKTVKYAGPYNYTTGVNNFTVYGFATPTWN